MGSMIGRIMIPPKDAYISIPHGKRDLGGMIGVIDADMGDYP